MIEKLAVVESSIPWPDHGAALTRDVAACVGAGISGIALSEAALRDGEDLESVREFIASGLRPTTAEPAGSMLSWGEPAGPQARAELICHSMRRLAPFDPIAVTFALPAPGAPEQSEGEALASAVRLIARTGALLHPHAVHAAVMSGTDAPAAIDAWEAPGLQAVVEVSRLGGRGELERWADRLELVAAVRLRVRAGRPPAPVAEAVFAARDLDVQTVVDVLHGAGYRGFYEVEFEGAALESTDEVTGLLRATKWLIRSALAPHLRFRRGDIRVEEEIHG